MTNLTSERALTGSWLTDPAAQIVLGLLEEAGHQAFLVGGTVRNALMGLPVTDLDVATDATPDRVMSLAQARNLKVIPTGIDHGTLTILADGEPVEVTTFRRDVATDGRRATIAYTDSVAEDARRRDFTMNALYVDRRGRILDPLSGLDDVLARRVRFIEDADRRLQEDHLRALRFFRFAARYSAGMPLDSQAIAAIGRNLAGLQTLSAERIGAEVIKILEVEDPTSTLHAMQAIGVLGRILPDASVEAMPDLVSGEKQLGLAPSGLRRLAAMRYRDGAGLRLSRSDQKHLLMLQDLALGTASCEEIAWRKSADVACDVIALRHALHGAPIPDVSHLAFAEVTVFPLKSAELTADFSGPAIGQELARLQGIWIASGFQMTAMELRELVGRG